MSVAISPGGGGVVVVGVGAGDGGQGTLTELDAGDPQNGQVHRVPRVAVIIAPTGDKNLHAGRLESAIRPGRGRKRLASTAGRTTRP